MIRNILMSMMLTLFVISTASFSYASEAGVILKMLLKKGMITQAEYDEVSGELGETEGIKKRVEAVEKHVDKHITHAEGPAVTDGLNIAAGITMVGQGTSGNDDNAAPGEDVIDASISADIEISKSLGEHGEGFIALEAGEGDGLEGDEIDSYLGVNADATGSAASLSFTEAWYEHRFLNDMLTFTIGKLNMTNYFDGNEVANDETTQFLSGGFVNSIAIEFPANSSAARLTLSPIELLDITVGAQSGDSDWEDFAEKPFYMAEADIKPKFGELQGNYRIYVWTNTADHTEIADATSTKEDGSGYGISLDQQVTSFLTLFARWGHQSKKLYEIKSAWSGGLALGGSLWGRENDVVAAAYGQAILSDDKKDVLKAAGTNPGDEEHFEAYYNLLINEHVTISPDVQVVINAKGEDDFETVVIGALRGQFTF